MTTPSDIPLMWDDTREIYQVFNPLSDEDESWKVDDISGISRIVIYKERGATDYVPFAAIYCDDEIVLRLPMSQLGVGYK